MSVFLATVVIPLADIESQSTYYFASQELAMASFTLTNHKRPGQVIFVAQPGGVHQALLVNGDQKEVLGTITDLSIRGRILTEVEHF